MRCNEACERHYRIRTIDGALGAEACQAHPDGSGCVDSQFARRVRPQPLGPRVRSKLAAADLAAALCARQGPAAAAAVAADAAALAALPTFGRAAAAAAVAAAHAAAAALAAAAARAAALGARARA